MLHQLSSLALEVTSTYRRYSKTSHLHHTRLTTDIGCGTLTPAKELSSQEICGPQSFCRSNSKRPTHKSDAAHHRMNFVPFQILSPGEPRCWKSTEYEECETAHSLAEPKEERKNPIKRPSEIHHTNYTLKPTKSSPFWPLIKYAFFHVPGTALKAKDETDNPK
ncbi:hypothetical protein M441DRAFT_234731 [Trichoderma asperellum CBS 433.97]|uniref:Uncharacterized protein n=1 Tax=Trichoderma asperellum (strain ATCC 204424 / CBS 433.97 / NBRC 101777) TaxID=1042311 RepID=A0A2T3Z135_TRIA4|nr:hypothetical protein M441DRAFT_234731 [Trichoderma asperellum CBS 433.97]PTB38514.1 hypothetical protein M441DRAFT_234731 [Trichoderma asperellum CBS 433.97]